MKKQIFVVITIFTVHFCFSQVSRRDIEVSSGYSFYTIQTHDEYTINNGFPVGLSGAVYLDDLIGIGIYSNFIYLPQSVAGDTREAIVVKNGGGNILFGFDFFVAPVFVLYYSDKIKIPVAAGVRANLFMATITSSTNNTKREMDYSETNYGIGFSIGIEYHLGRRVYLFGRIQGGFDFINIVDSKTKLTTRFPNGTAVTEDKESSVGWGASWGFIPQAGIGISF